MPFVHRLEERWGQDREASIFLTIAKEQDCVPEGVREHNADRFSELCRVQDLLIRDLEQRARSADIAMRESTGRLRCSEVAPRAPAGSVGHVRDSDGLVADLRGLIDGLTLQVSPRLESPSLEERGRFLKT
ncbi:hypothetical protein DL767_009385 [Monosporascus sp. MG133]|nr:hypothetical protein DL767_009385 [Monosporascus sp. MG133]